MCMCIYIDTDTHLDETISFAYISYNMSHTTNLNLTIQRLAATFTLNPHKDLVHIISHNSGHYITNLHNPLLKGKTYWKLPYILASNLIPH